MKLYDRISKANDKAALLEYRLGNPLRRTMVLSHRSLDENYQPITKNTVVWPPPEITSVKPRLVGLTISSGNSSNTGITVSADDYSAKVSRSFRKEDFFKESQERATVWIDVPLSDSGEIEALTGTECRIIHIDDSDCCEWKMILRKLKD